MEPPRGNSSPWLSHGPFIEIDGLPNLKMGGFSHGELLNNQMDSGITSLGLFWGFNVVTLTEFDVGFDRLNHWDSFRAIIGCLVGGFKPSEKYESQLELLFPIYGKIKHVPNHQPDVKGVSLGHSWAVENSPVGYGNRELYCQGF